MSIKFTPGPHPTSQNRSASSSSIPRPNSPRTDSPTQPRAPHPTPDQPHFLTQGSHNQFSPVSPSPLSSNFPQRQNLNQSSPGGGHVDLERQPLLPPPETSSNRARTLWPVVSVLAIIVVLGLMIGFGGWRLGQGEGGGRWPGGPH